MQLYTLHTIQHRHASQRDRQILDIAKSVNDLATVFKELNVLVSK
jgi:hypothetical protein